MSIIVPDKIVKLKINERRSIEVTVPLVADVQEIMRVAGVKFQARDPTSIDGTEAEWRLLAGK